MTSVINSLLEKMEGSSSHYTKINKRAPIDFEWGCIAPAIYSKVSKSLSFYYIYIQVSLYQDLFVAL